MNVKNLAAVAIYATIFSIPLCHASTITTAGYVAETAPDAISRQILRHPVRAFEEGALDSSDNASAIERNYPKIIEQSLAGMRSTTAADWIDQLSDLELEHTAQLYVNSNATAGRSGKLLLVAASRLDGAHLARLSRFFGYHEVYAAVIEVAPKSASAFLSHTPVAYPAPLAGAPLRSPSALALTAGGGATTMGSFTPSVSMTLRQLYTGFRSMQVGSMASTAAMYETTMYSGKHLVIA